MLLHKLQKPYRRKKVKRVGRGNSSGRGTYSGRGVKGQKARSGFHKKLGFEGGQNPLVRRLPKKRGFQNPRHTQVIALNVGSLNAWFKKDETVDMKSLRHYRKANRSGQKLVLKILGFGDLQKALVVHAHHFTKQAREKIEKKGGKAILISKDKK